MYEMRKRTNALLVNKNSKDSFLLYKILKISSNAYKCQDCNYATRNPLRKDCIISMKFDSLNQFTPELRTRILTETIQPIKINVNETPSKENVRQKTSSTDSMSQIELKKVTIFSLKICL